LWSIHTVSPPIPTERDQNRKIVSCQGTLIA
jgi:hypothetical protein